MCFLIFYGMVVINMQRRKRDSQFESNRYGEKFNMFCVFTVAGEFSQVSVPNLSTTSTIFKRFSPGGDMIHR